MQTGVQTCFQCADFEAKLVALTQERDNLMALYETAHSRATAAELQVRRLKVELNGSTTKETEAVREVCAYHDEKWKQAFPRARGLKYPMDGAGPKKVRWALRREFTTGDCKKAIDGAFSDSWYLGQNNRQTPYVKLANIFRDEEAIHDHIGREQRVLDRQLLEQERRLTQDRETWQKLKKTRQTAPQETVRQQAESLQLFLEQKWAEYVARKQTDQTKQTAA